VLCLSVERWLALKTAFGKGNLTKFVANIKASLKANDFATAETLCNKMQGSVANVVLASLNAYKEMDKGANASLKKSQKVAKIQQAHEEATQLEMPTLQMNLPLIATMVTLGTLTGLLGTVTGMIKSFQALAAGGGGDSLALSAGISEALINTAFGIATSWCAVISYNFFTNKIDKLTYALDEVGYSIAQTYEANHTDEA
jgi:biopolymer transport protein ExbB